MEFYSVVSKKTYTNKNGEEKVKWLNIGTLKKTNDGKMFLELNHMPNESFYVFEQKQEN